MFPAMIKYEKWTEENELVLNFEWEKLNENES